MQVAANTAAAPEVLHRLCVVAAVRVYREAADLIAKVDKELDQTQSKASAPAKIKSEVLRSVTTEGSGDSTPNL